MARFLQSLHAARGIACVLVVVAHVAVWEQPIGPRVPLLQWVQWFGYAAVDLFFVLSGFVITYTQWDKVGKPDAVLTYFRARFLRVFPLLWLLLPLAVLQVHAIHGMPRIEPSGDPLTRWLCWVFLLPHGTINPYLPSTWTLPFELSFYVLFGLLLPWGRGVMITGLLIWGSLPLLLPDREHPAVHLLASPHVWEILFGCTAAGLVRAGWLRGGPWWIAASFVWATLGVIVQNPHTTPSYLSADPWARCWTFGLAAAALVYGLAVCELQRGWRIPNVLRWVGDASYSIYLAHIPFGSLLFGLTLRQWPHTFLGHLAWVLAMLSVCLGGGVMTYLLLERPLMNRTRRKCVGPTSLLPPPLPIPSLTLPIPSLPIPSLTIPSLTMPWTAMLTWRTTSSPSAQHTTECAGGDHRSHQASEQSGS